jgi:hypothetical protein
MMRILELMKTASEIAYEEHALFAFVVVAGPSYSIIVLLLLAFVAVINTSVTGFNFRYI